jgi:hypothetical protein
MDMMLICDREMMVPENGGMSVKEGKILYYYLLSKNMKIKIYGTVTLPAVL